MAHARRRNREAIAEGRMELHLGHVERLPNLDDRFDAIMAINAIGFWSEPTARLAELRQRLRPGGRLAVTVQPRCQARRRPPASAYAANWRSGSGSRRFQQCGEPHAAR